MHTISLEQWCPPVESATHHIEECIENQSIISIYYNEIAYKIVLGNLSFHFTVHDSENKYNCK